MSDYRWLYSLPILPPGSLSSLSIPAKLEAVLHNTSCHFRSSHVTFVFVGAFSRETNNNGQIRPCRAPCPAWPGRETTHFSRRHSCLRRAWPLGRPQDPPSRCRAAGARFGLESHPTLPQGTLLGVLWSLHPHLVWRWRRCTGCPE